MRLNYLFVFFPPRKMTLERALQLQDNLPGIISAFLFPQRGKKKVSLVLVKQFLITSEAASFGLHLALKPGLQSTLGSLFLVVFFNSVKNHMWTYVGAERERESQRTVALSQQMCERARKKCKRSSSFKVRNFRHNPSYGKVVLNPNN